MLLRSLLHVPLTGETFNRVGSEGLQMRKTLYASDEELIYAAFTNMQRKISFLTGRDLQQNQGGPQDRGRGAEI